MPRKHRLPEPTMTRAIGIAVTVLALGACGGGARLTDSPLGDGLAKACPVILPVQALPQSERNCNESSNTRLHTISDEGIGLTSSLGLAPGRFALPADAQPTKLVVMFHGHQNDSCAWRNHLREAAASGAVAIAMDYSDQEDRELEGFGLIENWGWAVRSGAADSILAARYFMERYPSIEYVLNFGVSMGGNVSGYAAYSEDAVRADCSPLWDHWVVAEGVHNLTEEYLGATTLEPVNATAQQARIEIEEENGGTFDEVPERYTEITNVAHTEEMAYLKGVVMTHGTNDQTVPIDQSRAMSTSFRAYGVPVQMFSVAGSDHVWEGNGEAAVIRLALDAMTDLLNGGSVVDGETPAAEF